MKKRNGILAFVLALVSPAIAQFYLCRPKRGFAYIAFPATYSFVYFVLSRHFHYSLSLIFIGAYTFWYLAVILEAPFGAKRINKTELKSNWYNRWYIYLSFFIIAGLADQFTESLLNRISGGALGFAFTIPAEDMSPTLVPGDNVVVDKLKDAISDFERGDLIVFISPTDNSTPFVKRLVGFEGEKIEIKSGKLYIDGVLTPEKVDFAEEKSFKLTMIPEGSFYVLGDNRQNSFDSRYFGPISEKSIYGKVVFLYWSDESGRIGKINNNWFEPAASGQRR